ncbi:MAG TPA: ferrous iron transport protein B [Candidatus Avibacteroides avistercoris]|uniref:Ferrous iron transport protein B n=1 Tax=Candidatus Avibacteroides avistercoris TaxID=2840690 RepID=A0A9D2UI79_9BACT|nr:ferrous iron transport protein B [Candidatus Avibacteroides avistercoris]
MRLSELKTGDKGVVVKVLGHGGFRKRIVEMGFVKGKSVEVLLNAPLKDPVKYRIMGYEISLRRSEAEMIEVVSRDDVALNDELLRTDDGNYAPTVVEEKELATIAANQRKQINVALVGNPNCGKTSLFNLASGAHEHVGNYSGVTVDAKEGYFDFQGYHFKIVDLPGTYSLSAYSPEEIYVRKHIVEETPDVIINVVDASNLERNLYLTTELIDMNVRLVVALNMYDELEKSGSRLDNVQLSRLFGVPMVPTVCRRGEGIDNLFHTIIELYEGADFIDADGKMNADIEKGMIDWHRKFVKDHDYGMQADRSEDGPRISRHIHINHGTEIEQGIAAIQVELKRNQALRDRYSTRFLAIKALEHDRDVEAIIMSLPNSGEVLSVRDREEARISSILNEDCEASITNAKYGFISGALKETYREKHRQDGRQMTKLLDMLFTHRVWGYPIFFLIMFVMFECTFILGDYPMQWIEWLVARLSDLVSSALPAGPVKDMLVDGVIGGVGAVIVFLPNILILYFCISIMEDSGYMARAAFIMDKIMHKMGLHGKSFIPLLMGFGCNVPAVMATRTIESPKTRLVTMLIVPLMSCSARLPLFILFAGAFFPKHSGLALFGMYLIGIAMSVVMARLFTRFVIRGEDTPFVMELPPYRMPTAKSIFRHTWEKGRQYLKKMGGIILVASIVIWFLGYYPRNEAYVTPAEQQENSYIGKIGKAIEPAIRPLGFDWQLGVGLLSGAGAKELVVSSLSVLYNNEAEVDGEGWTSRLGITPLVGFCYMLFVLLYFPCVATIAAIREESGRWRWALFTVVYTTLLAWIVTFVVYQVGSLFV